jgi:hypothetical protein
MKIGYVIALVLATIAISALAPAEVRSFLASESGPIEWATVACYAAALGYILFRGLYQKAKWIFWLVVIFMMRELDFDARFTTGKITKLDFYLAPDLQLLQALYAFALLGGFFFVVFMVVKTYGKSLAVEVKEWTPIGLATILALMAIGFSKLIDGPRRKASYVGIDLSDQAIAIAQIIEESVELLLPLMIIVALSHYYHRTLESSSPFAAGH